MATMTFPARLEDLESMIRFIVSGAEKQGFSGKKVNQIRLAAEEVLVNVISYAYPDKDGSVEITCNIEKGERLVIKIIDWGIPFDPLSLPDPDIETPIEERKIGGLGIYITRNIMDEVSYERSADRNILTLVKY